MTAPANLREFTDGLLGFLTTNLAPKLVGDHEAPDDAIDDDGRVTTSYAVVYLLDDQPAKNDMEVVSIDRMHKIQVTCVASYRTDAQWLGDKVRELLTDVTLWSTWQPTGRAITLVESPNVDSSRTMADNDLVPSLFYSIVRLDIFTTAV